MAGRKVSAVEIAGNIEPSSGQTFKGEREMYEQIIGLGITVGGLIVLIVRQ